MVLSNRLHDDDASVAIKHSMWRNGGAPKSFYGRFYGLLAGDCATVSLISHRNRCVCLIDLLNGERAQIMAETLKAEIEFAETMGLPKPDTVEDPKCINNRCLAGCYHDCALIVFLPTT